MWLNFFAVRARFATLLLLFGLTACSFFSAKPQLHGNPVHAFQLKELTPGVSTEADVMRVLGSPTATGTFDNNKWIYLSQVTQERIGRVQAVRKQHVVVLSFNNQGILEGVKKYTKKNALQVEMASGSTPSPGSSTTFFGELFGSVGHALPALGPGQGGM